MADRLTLKDCECRRILVCLKTGTPVSLSTPPGVGARNHQRFGSSKEFRRIDSLLGSCCQKSAASFSGMAVPVEMVLSQ